MVEMKKLLNDIFDCIKNDELKFLVSESQIQVPGFSRKRIINAPVSLIKKELNRNPESIKLLEKLIQEKRAHYDKNETFKYFWWKLINDSNMTPVKRLLLLYFYHPEKYDEYSKYIVGTSEQITIDMEQIPFAHHLKIQLDLFELTDTKKWLYETFEKSIHVETETVSIKESLQSWLDKQLRDGTQILGKGWLLKFYFLKQGEWSSWKEPERDAWLHLVIRDIVMYLHTLHNKMEELQKQNAEMTNQLQLLEKKFVQDQEQWKKRLEKQGKQLEEQVAKLEKKSQDFADIKQKLKKCEAQVTIVEREKNNLELRCRQMEKELMGLDELLSHEAFVLVTRQKHPLLSRMLRPSQLQMLDDSTSYREWNVWLEKASTNVMYYIDISDFSTKEQFELESKLKERGINHRMISGNVMTLLRKIIGYLEGIA